jgi:hypothetical protein
MILLSPRGLSPGDGPACVFSDRGREGAVSMCREQDPCRPGCTTRPSPRRTRRAGVQPCRGTAPAPSRRCALGITREGSINTSVGGISWVTQGGSVLRDSVRREEALTATRGESTVRPDQTAGTTREHRQSRTVESGGETGYPLVHRWAPSLL